MCFSKAAESALATLRFHYEGLAHDLLGDLPADDLASCWSVLATIQSRLGNVVDGRMAAAPPAAGPRIGPLRLFCVWGARDVV